MTKLQIIDVASTSDALIANLPSFPAWWHETRIWRGGRGQSYKRRRCHTYVTRFESKIFGVRCTTNCKVYWVELYELKDVHEEGWVDVGSLSYEDAIEIQKEADWRACYNWRDRYLSELTTYAVIAVL